ncbi:TetR family transcriptional regulator [Bacillus sp. AFS053548]|uniref:TetR family transcriptional regulator n=1 Tax=Bacillus sp. AFS053548 TaxID=2033505 RepID=UPI0011451DD1|nr:TetR family transcriptional regulator [Bacillus sp. AFS053548]
MDMRIRINHEDVLISLMKKNDFERITINSFAEKADVSRGTIYLQFLTSPTL